jgi:hypothetical protein
MAGKKVTNKAGTMRKPPSRKKKPKLASARKKTRKA